MSYAPDDAIADPWLRSLVEATEREYHGFGDCVEVVVNGARSVIRVEADLGAARSPSIVGNELVSALNQALERAEDAVGQVLRGHPSLSAGLADGLPVDDSGLHGERLAGDFEGGAADGLVSARVSGRTRRFVSIYLHSLSADLVGEVPRAANRAMAAAELGREGAVPLDEQIDSALARLDSRLGSINTQLDAVEAELDSVLRALG